MHMRTAQQSAILILGKYQVTCNKRYYSNIIFNKSIPVTIDNVYLDRSCGSKTVAGTLIASLKRQQYGWALEFPFNNVCSTNENKL